MNSADKSRARYILLLCVVPVGLNLLCIALSGCNGYSSESLFTDDVRSVYVEMFDNRSFRRGIEYELTDAISKRIEAGTPYKVVSDRSRADTVISGQIVSAEKSIFSFERETGRALENEMVLDAVVSWKDLKTGELLIDSRRVSASASFSEWQRQGENYGLAAAANRLAVKIVEQMETKW